MQRKARLNLRLTGQTNLTQLFSSFVGIGRLRVGRRKRSGFWRFGSRGASVAGLEVSALNRREIWHDPGHSKRIFPFGDLPIGLLLMSSRRS